MLVDLEVRRVLVGGWGRGWGCTCTPSLLVAPAPDCPVEAGSWEEDDGDHDNLMEEHGGLDSPE